MDLPTEVENNLPTKFTDEFTDGS